LGFIYFQDSQEASHLLAGKCKGDLCYLGRPERVKPGERIPGALQDAPMSVSACLTHSGVVMDGQQDIAQGQSIRPSVGLESPAGERGGSMGLAVG